MEFIFKIATKKCWKRKKNILQFATSESINQSNQFGLCMFYYIDPTDQ